MSAMCAQEWEVSEKLSGQSNKRETFLGGEDFKNASLEILVIDFKRSEANDLSNRIDWPCRTQTECNLPLIMADSSREKQLDVTLTISKFESLVNNLIQSTWEPCKSYLKDASIITKDVNEVLLAGRMEVFRKYKK